MASNGKVFPVRPILVTPALWTALEHRRDSGKCPTGQRGDIPFANRALEAKVELATMSRVLIIIKTVYSIRRALMESNNALRPVVAPSIPLVAVFAGGDGGGGGSGGGGKPAPLLRSSSVSRSTEGGARTPASSMAEG